MAYSTQNGTAVNVTNFGARGDGVTMDTAAIQRAIDYAGQIGNTTVFFPKGNYLTSGYLHVTGRASNNLTLFGEENSWIRSAPDGNPYKINISGTSGVSLLNLNIDGGRGTGLTQDDSIIAVQCYGANSFSIKDCYLANTRGHLVGVKAGSSCGLIEGNTFENYYVGIYGDTNEDLGNPYNRLIINNNTFLSGWGDAIGFITDGQPYFGAIKLQGVGGEVSATGQGIGPYSQIVSGRTYGHVITNNTIQDSSQMGIELWGFVYDSVVANNTISRVPFGISIAANSQNIAVTNNTIKEIYFLGIELADSFYVTVANNVVDCATGKWPSQVAPNVNGIILNGVNRRPNYYNVVGNTVKNAGSALIKNFVSNYTNIVGNQLICDISGAGFSYYVQDSSFINFSNNQLIQNASGIGGGGFIFLDANSLGVTGVRIASNDFCGYMNYWGISYYNAGSLTNNSHDVLIENNSTANVKWGIYGMMDNFNNPPTNAIHRNNVGQTGGLGYYISDWEYPYPSAYSSTAIQDGHQFYGRSTITIPSSGIPYSSGAWVCISSGDAGGNIFNQRFAVKYTSLGPPYDFDGSQENIEFFVSSKPYGGSPTIFVTPQNSYGTNIVDQIYADAHNGDTDVSVWLNLHSGSTGTANYQMYVYYPDSRGISSPSVQFVRPAFSSAARGLSVNNINRKYMKLLDGLQIGAGSYLSSDTSGTLNYISANHYLSGNVGLNVSNPNAALHVNGAITLSGISTSTTANVGAATLPANPVSFITVNITGGNFKIPYYNI